jgi:hypothetical protein
MKVPVRTDGGAKTHLAAAFISQDFLEINQLQ